MILALGYTGYVAQFRYSLEAVVLRCRFSPGWGGRREIAPTILWSTIARDPSWTCSELPC